MDTTTSDITVYVTRGARQEVKVTFGVDAYESQKRHALVSAFADARQYLPMIFDLVNSSTQSRIAYTSLMRWNPTNGAHYELVERQW